MNKLTFITLLEKRIKGEITRLEQTTSLDWEKEQHRLEIYQQLARHYEIPL